MEVTKSGAVTARFLDFTDATCLASLVLSGTGGIGYRTVLGPIKMDIILEDYCKDPSTR